MIFFTKFQGLHNILDLLMPEGLAVVTFLELQTSYGRKGGEEEGEGEVDAQMIYTFTPVADDDDYVIYVFL